MALDFKLPVWAKSGVRNRGIN